MKQHLGKAFEYYKRAAQAGNQQAKSLLTPQSDLHCRGKAMSVGRRSVFWSSSDACVLLLQSQDKSDHVLSLSLPSSPVEEAMLRSIRSSPCFSGADHPLQRPLSALVSGVPHSWSTGSLFVPSTLSFTPPHLHPHSGEGATCQWTVGMG